MNRSHFSQIAKTNGYGAYLADKIVKFYQNKEWKEAQSAVLEAKALKTHDTKVVIYIPSMRHE